MRVVGQSRAVVITEAASPATLATAARLAAAGDLVLMGTRRTDVCERLATRLRSAGASAFAAHLDIADPLSVDEFIEAAAYLIGTADVLISAAGLADGSWFGAQHLVTQLVSPMLDRGHGEVVLLSPDLVGASSTAARRMLDAWVAGLDAEFVGTGVRASIIRSSSGEAIAPGDIGYLIATMLDSSDMHLRVVDAIAPMPTASKSTPVQGVT